MQTTDSELARRLLGLIDLTSLNANDNEASTESLAAQAVTPAGNVAAVCLWPRFIATARRALEGKGVLVATVVNFPGGELDARRAAADTAAALAAGADEIDLVFPYRALLSGDEATGLAVVRACRQACAQRGLLKVILETGQLATPAAIRRCAELAVQGGAQFLKTSTGKTQPGATPEAVSIMIDVIAAARKDGNSVGLKVSGGISRVADAGRYLDLFERRFGAGSATPATFRIGASSLMAPILTALG